MAPKKAIVGVVENQTQAGNVVAKLRLQGFATRVISILFPDESRIRRARGHGSEQPPPSDGGAVGFFSDFSAATIPGVGPVIAGGPLAHMIEDAPGLADCLTSLGIPILEARQCERDLRAGAILIAVHVEHPSLRSFVKEVFNCDGAAGVDTLDERTSPFDHAA